jgi:hypothetical protein
MKSSMTTPSSPTKAMLEVSEIEKAAGQGALPARRPMP